MSAGAIDAGGAGFRLSLVDELTKPLTSTLASSLSITTGAVKGINSQVKSMGRQLQVTGKSIAATSLAVSAVGAGSAFSFIKMLGAASSATEAVAKFDSVFKEQAASCLLYTSPSPRDATLSRMPSSA